MSKKEFLAIGAIIIVLVSILLSADKVMENRANNHIKQIEMIDKNHSTE